MMASSNQYGSPHEDGPIEGDLIDPDDRKVSISHPVFSKSHELMT